MGQFTAINHVTVVIVVLVAAFVIDTRIAFSDEAQIDQVRLKDGIIQDKYLRKNNVLIRDIKVVADDIQGECYILVKIINGDTIEHLVEQDDYNQLEVGGKLKVLYFYTKGLFRYHIRNISMIKINDW